MAVDTRRLDTRTAAETHALEMSARAQEAGAFTAAVRTILRDLDAVLLRPQYEYPVEALALTARLRGTTDRYERRWEDAA